MTQGPGGFVDSRPAFIVAAADGRHESRIPASASFTTVGAHTTNANDWVVLPAGVQPGHQVRCWSVPAHELRTSGGDLPINGVDSDGTQEAAIPATSLWTATYINATIGWVLEVTSELGATVTAVIPD